MLANSKMSLRIEGDEIYNPENDTNYKCEDGAYKSLIKVNDTDYLAVSNTGNLWFLSQNDEIHGHPGYLFVDNLNCIPKSIAQIKDGDEIIVYIQIGDKWKWIYPGLKPGRRQLVVFDVKPRDIEGDVIIGDLVGYTDQSIKTTEGSWMIDCHQAFKINPMKNANTKV